MKEKILELRNKGYTYRSIASELGISSTKVSNIINNKFEYNKGWKRNKCVELRKSGMKIKDICNEVGLCEAVVVSYTSFLNVRLSREPERRNEIIRLAQLGFDNNLIALNMGIKKSSVYHVLYKAGLRSNRWEYDNTEQMQECKALFIDGYPVDQISLITGLRLSEVKKYTRGFKVYTVKKPLVRKQSVKIITKIPKVMKIKKKEVKSKPLAIDQRAMLGKGFASGTYSLDVRLRPDRDDGVLLGIVYRDLGNVNKDIRIRIKESEDKESKAKNWCKKFGKKYVNYF